VLVFDLVIVAHIDDALSTDIGYIHSDLSILTVFQTPTCLPLFQNKQWRAVILSKL